MSARPPLLRQLRHLALRSVAFVVLLAAWEIANHFDLIRPFLLPPLGAVLDRTGNDVISGAFEGNAALTLYRALAGFAIACTIGIPLGIMVSRRRLVGWFVEPIVSVGFPMPTIAFLPIFML